MATFGFRKTRDDIEEGTPMPEDWYSFEIAKEVEVKPNNALKQATNGSEDEAELDAAMKMDEKCGLNMVIPLVCIDENEEYKGRRLTLYLQYPSEYDEDRYDGVGQKKYDSKLQTIMDFTEAFGGDIDGEQVTLMKGMKGQCYVTIGLNPKSGKQTNQVDQFSGFKPLGD